MADGPTAALAVGGLVGVVLLSLPDLISGFLDSGRAGFVDPANDDLSTIESLNAVSFVGGALLLVVAIAFLGLLVKTAVASSDADDDPVEGNTLEWATASPPIIGNFGTIPPIKSEAPLYDARFAPEGDA